MNQYLKDLWDFFRGEFDDIPWKEQESQHGKYDKYFRYFTKIAIGHTFYERHAREGFEYLEHDNRPIELIDKEL